MIYIKYGFQFDENTLWAESDDFEVALSQAFETMNISMIRVAAAEGQENVPIFILAKKDLQDQVEEEPNEKPEGPMIPKGILRKLKVFKE